MTRIALDSGRVGTRDGETAGTIDVAVMVTHDTIVVYELPLSVWEAIKNDGYIEIEDAE